MIDALPYAVRLPQPGCGTRELTSAGRDLLEALDAWLADDQTTGDYVHVQGWTDVDSESAE